MAAESLMSRLCEPFSETFGVDHLGGFESLVFVVRPTLRICSIIGSQHPAVERWQRDI
jgi:hypothetical protein